jgi:hypothetical protein
MGRYRGDKGIETSSNDPAKNKNLLGRQEGRKAGKKG